MENKCFFRPLSGVLPAIAGFLSLREVNALAWTNRAIYQGVFACDAVWKTLLRRDVLHQKRVPLVDDVCSILNAVDGRTNVSRLDVYGVFHQKPIKGRWSDAAVWTTLSNLSLATSGLWSASFHASYLPAMYQLQIDYCRQYECTSVTNVHDTNKLVVERYDVNALLVRRQR